jgi:predicted XRE-type DNA-binding protein
MSKPTTQQKRAELARQDMLENKGNSTDFSTVGLDDEGLLKRSISLKIREYRFNNNISNLQLAKILSATVAQIDNIMHLKIEEFEVSELVKFLEVTQK